MNLSKILIILLLCSSCSTIGDAFRQANVHKEMTTAIDQVPYEMNLADLQGKIIEYFGSMNLNGKWISTHSTDTNSLKKKAEVQDQMEEGFMYKDKFYTSIWSVDMTVLSGDMDKIKNSIFKSSYHVLENNDKGFLIVKGGNIYEGKKIGESKSSLKVYHLTRLIRPVTINLDWWKLATGKGLFASFDSLPVDLESSRKYEQEDMVVKLSLFFFIDKEKAEKLEAELMAKEKEKELLREKQG